MAMKSIAAIFFNRFLGVFATSFMPSTTAKPVAPMKILKELLFVAARFITANWVLSPSSITRIEIMKTK